MSDSDSVFVSSSGIVEVDDPALESLDREWEPAARPVDRVRGEDTELMGRAGASEAPSDDPFDLEIAKPRAIDLLELYQRLDLECPADIEATLGAKRPILLCHGMTPFYKAGHRPTGVWGMGYRAGVGGDLASTVSLMPDSELVEVAQAKQDLTFGVKIGGDISVPEEALELSSQVPGIALKSARLHATTDQSFGLAIECNFAVVKVQAGPVDAGGARWNLYRAKERIDVFQPLFHTVLVPETQAQLEVTIDTWVRRPGRFFGLVRARHWEYPPKSPRFSGAVGGGIRDTP